jgi:hypothetical protein
VSQLKLVLFLWQVSDYLLSNIENILLNGTQLILNQVFKLTGLDVIGDDILRHLVTARLCQPASKAGTVDYLKSYFDEDVELHKIYRYLDRLHNTQQEGIQQISVEHIRRILGGKKVLNIAKTITTLKIRLPVSGEIMAKTMILTAKHKSIACLFNPDFWKTFD